MRTGVAGHAGKLFIEDEYPGRTTYESTIHTRTSSEDIGYENRVGFERGLEWDWESWGLRLGCELHTYTCTRPALVGG